MSNGASPGCHYDNGQSSRRRTHHSAHQLQSDKFASDMKTACFFWLAFVTCLTIADRQSAQLKSFTVGLSLPGPAETWPVLGLESLFCLSKHKEYPSASSRAGDAISRSFPQKAIRQILEGEPSRFDSIGLVIFDVMKERNLGRW